MTTLNGWQRCHWVLETARRNHLTGNATVVLLALATYADNATGRAYPSKSTLVRVSGLSTSKVDRAMKELRAKGVIEISVPASSTGRANVYSIHQYNRIPTRDPGKPQGGLTEAQPPSTSGLHGGDSSQTHEQPEQSGEAPVSAPGGNGTETGLAPMPKGGAPLQTQLSHKLSHNLSFSTSLDELSQGGTDTKDCHIDAEHTQVVNQDGERGNHRKLDADLKVANEHVKQGPCEPDDAPQWMDDDLNKQFRQMLDNVADLKKKYG